MSTARSTMNVGLTGGVLEASMAIALFLTGMASIQVWNYYRERPDESKWLRILVGGMFIADLIHACLLLHASYYYTILKFGDFVALNTLVWSLGVAVVLGAFIVFGIQTFFCARVKRATGSWVVSGGCWALVTARLIFTLWSVATVFNGANFAVTQSKAFKWQCLSALSIGAVSDLIIASFICRALTQGKEEFVAVTDLVDRMIAYMFGSGLFTSVVAFTSLIAYVASPTSFLFLAFIYILPKIINISLLESLDEGRKSRYEISSSVFKGRSNRSRSTEQRQAAETMPQFEMSNTQTQVERVRYEASSFKGRDIKSTLGLRESDEDLGYQASGRSSPPKQIMVHVTVDQTSHY
ncbi:hypothetical protein AURDEDRAFT_188959 [Auricularia subglabra TFB-10046 SS5]|nr:hypothetical protein AURDEDRAFT_188959 [Auricularia subglabra TFB-10046 SS5]